MYFDTVVIAGIGTVLLMVGFFASVAVFIKSDMKRNDTKDALKVPVYEENAVCRGGA